MRGSTAHFDNDAQGSSSAGVLSFVVEQPLQGTAFVASPIGGSESPAR